MAEYYWNDVETAAMLTWLEELNILVLKNPQWEFILKICGATECIVRGPLEWMFAACSTVNIVSNSRSYKQ